MNKSKSFGITIRPKCGVLSNSAFQDKILKACKSADYYQCVSEKEDVERHLHIQLWYNEPKYKGDIKKKFERICAKEMFWDADHKRHCIKIKFCYNDWILNYCEENDIKLDASELLLDNMPAITDDYYPSEDEQEKMLNKSQAVDQKFYRWEELWNEYEHKVDNPELIDIAKFLGDMMFKSRKIQVIVDDKARKQNCVCLLAYIQKSKSAKLFLTKEQWEVHCLELEISQNS